MVSLLYDIVVNLFIKVESGAIFKGFSCKGVDGAKWRRRTVIR